MMSRCLTACLLAAALVLSMNLPCSAEDGVDATMIPEQTPPQASPPTAEATPPELLPIGSDIEDWQARWELARLLSYTQRYDESLAQYRLLLEEKPGLEAARVEMATVLFWAGKVDEATAILSGASQENLTPEAKRALIDIYIGGKQYDQAEALLHSYLADHPDDDPARLKLADILSWTERYDASLAQYEIILEHRPDDVQIRRKYAYVLIWAGQRDKAEQELLRSLGE